MNLALRIGLALVVIAAAVGLGVRAAGAGAVVRCGDVSQIVAPTETEEGSFLLTTADTSVKVVAPAGARVSDVIGYTCVSLVPFWTFLPLATSDGWPGSMQTTVCAAASPAFDAGGGVSIFGAVFLTWAAGAQSCKASRRAAGVSNFIFGLCSVALFTKEF